MKTLTFPLAAALFLSSQFALADAHPGAALHDDANCMSCHTDQPYNPSVTTSFPKLLEKVGACNANLNVGMFDDEVAQVAEYLNQTYYKHEK